MKGPYDARRTRAGRMATKPDLAMTQKRSQTERLFGRDPSDIPEWMAIRDADAKRRGANQAKQKAARLAREADVAAQDGAPVSRPRKNSTRKVRPKQS